MLLIAFNFYINRIVKLYLNKISIVLINNILILLLQSFYYKKQI